VGGGGEVNITDLGCRFVLFKEPRKGKNTALVMAKTKGQFLLLTLDLGVWGERKLRI